MKRLIFKIFLVLVILAAVGAAAVVVILNTDMPQKLILKSLNKSLGMKVTAGSLRTGFWGKTDITDFTLSLPMENTPMLEMPEIEISHTSIPVLILGGSFTLNSVKIVNPLIDVKKEQTGSWNIQEFVYRVQQIMAKGGQSDFSLPRLDIINCTAIITDSNGAAERIGPVNIKGNSGKQLVWDFNMNIGSQIMLSGKVAQRSDWSHELKIEINNLPKPLRNLIPDVTEPLIVKAGWKGNFHDNQLEGQLQLEQAQSGKIQAGGKIQIKVLSGKLTVDLDNFLVKGFTSPLDQIKILGGLLTYDGRQIQAQRILVDTAQSKISFSGKWNLNERQGDFNCFCSGFVPEKNINYENTLYGMIGLPKIGQQEITVSVDTKGRSPWGNWQSQSNILGTGTEWPPSQWQVSVPSLTLETENKNISASDIKAEISANWPEIKLVNFNFANAEQLKAEGQYSADTKLWKVSFDSEGMKIIEDQNAPVDINLIAGGNLENINVSKFRIAYNDTQIEAAGDVNLPEKKLSNAYAKASVKLRSRPDPNNSFSALSGNFDCETEVSGTIWPININLQAMLSGDNITMNKNVIEPVKIPWQAQIDANEIKYDASQFKLFDGSWNLNGRYVFAQQLSQFTFNTNQVSLQPVIKLFDLPIESSGQMGASLDVNFSANDISQMVISGDWNVKDMVLPPIETQSAEGRIRIQNGIAVFDRIHLKQNNGTASARAWFRMDQPQFVYVRVDTRKWPLRFQDQDIAMITDANGTATLNLTKRTMKGKGYLSTSIAINDRKLADISTELAVEERLLDLNDIKIDTLGGHGNGKITIPLDSWSESRASMDWQDVNISELALFWPDCNGLEGKASGTLTAAHTSDKRAFEPLQITIEGNILNGEYKNASLGKYNVSAYLDKTRLFVDKAEIEAMRGTIKSSGNITRHGKEFTTYMNADFSQVELNQLLHLFLSDAKPVLGTLTGNGKLVIASDLHGLTGQADIQLNRSDLAHTMIIGTLYNVMKLKFGNQEPKGQGQISLRFEGSSLQIPSFTYFNRGVEIRGSGSIEDLAKGSNSPVTGYAVGSARPLKGISLLGIGELDQLMDSIQTNVSSVKIQGTLAKPEVVSVPFQVISTSMRALLWNQLHK